MEVQNFASPKEGVWYSPEDNLLIVIEKSKKKIVTLAGYSQLAQLYYINDGESELEMFISPSFSEHIKYIGEI